jgi:hypothetical protein
MTIKELEVKIDRIISLLAKMTKLPESEIRGYCEGGNGKELIYTKHLTTQKDEAINS